MKAERTFRVVGVGSIVLLVAFIVFAIVRASNPSDGKFPAVPAPSELHPGSHAQSFHLARLGGGAAVIHTSRSLQPVVLNFFASWCANCVAELHTFATVSSSAKGVTFVGIDTNDSAHGTAEHLVRGAKIPYPIGVDTNGAVADRYRVAALPVTFFIAKNGVVMGELFGQVDSSQLRAWVARLQRETQ